MINIFCTSVKTDCVHVHVDIDECFSGEFECFQCVNTPGSYECLCPEGFRSISAIQCESCRKNSYKSVTDASCIDCPSDSQTDGEGKTSVRDCVCNPGFTGNPARGIPCKDIDECKTNTHYCQQKCRNSIGSYTCGCSQGFTLIDKLHCEEIVEPVDSRPTVQLSCADHNGLCSHVCSDEEFGCVRCSCPEEFRLLWNNRTCEGNLSAEISVTGNESSFPLILNTRRTCAHRNGFCSQMCSEDEHGGVRCSCHEGFKLLWDTTTCDEVSASTYSRPRSCADSNGFCSQVCRNGNRGVRCSCRKGFQLLSDERTCVDIDECSSGEFECFRCVNTPGSYECLCPEGFVARAIRCEKLVEPVDSRPTVPRSCADSNGFCSHVCREWHSDIQCSCPEGFRLLPDRRTCVDVDECANSVLNKCDHDCHNTEGGYSCSCRAGYISYNGFKCEGCRKNSYQSVTDASCIDCPPDSQTDGEGKTSVRDCVCKPGFTGNPARGIPCK
ncbi:fibrillin 1, partial [Caerostris darwini]